MATKPPTRYVYIYIYTNLLFSVVLCWPFPTKKGVIHRFFNPLPPGVMVIDTDEVHYDWL